MMTKFHFGKTEIHPYKYYFVYDNKCTSVYESRILTLFSSLEVKGQGPLDLIQPFVSVTSQNEQTGQRFTVTSRAVNATEVDLNSG